MHPTMNVKPKLEYRYGFQAIFHYVKLLYLLIYVKQEAFGCSQDLTLHISEMMLNNSNNSVFVSMHVHAFP